MAKAIWEDVYLAAQKTSLTAPPKTFLSTDIGADIGKCAIPLTGHPNFSLGASTISVDRLSGIPMNRYEDMEIDMMLCETTYEFELDIKTFSLFCYLFFQKGSAQPTVNEKTYFIYDSTDCEVWATLCRRLSTGAADSQVLDGAVCSELKITGRVGEAIKVSATMIGRSLSTNFDWDAQSSVAVFPEDQVFLFMNAVVTGSLFSSGTPVESFSLTLQNGVQPVYYGGPQPYEFRLGKITGSFEALVSYNSISAARKAVPLSSATASVSFNVGRPLSFHLEGAGKLVSETESEGEVMCQVALDIKSVGAFPTSAVSIYMQDNVNRGIPVSR